MYKLKFQLYTSFFHGRLAKIRWGSGGLCSQECKYFSKNLECVHRSGVACITPCIFLSVFLESVFSKSVFSESVFSESVFFESVFFESVFFESVFFKSVFF